MKNALLVVFLSVLLGCNTSTEEIQASPDSRIIEQTILWQAEMDPVTWEPLALNKLLEDASRFEKQGNFYQVKDDTTAFGHAVSYIGTLGIDLIPGPNAVLKGSARRVASYIEQHHGIKFTKVEGEYKAKLKEHIVLCIAPHPSIRNSSMIIGAYLGP